MDSFNKEPNQKTPDYENTAHGANDISAVISVGVLQACGLSSRVDRHEGDYEAGNIGKLVRSVTEDCQGSGDGAANSFGSTEDEAHTGH